MNASERIDAMAEAAPASVAAIMIAVRHDGLTTADVNTAAMATCRRHLTDVAMSVMEHLDDRDLDTMGIRGDAPTTGEVIRRIIRQIVKASCRVSGVGEEYLKKVAAEAANSPDLWPDPRSGLRLRAKVASLMAARSIDERKMSGSS